MHFLSFFIVFGSWGAVRRRRRTKRASASCSPPRWGGGELRGSKSRIHRNGKVFGPWPAVVRERAFANDSGPHDSDESQSFISKFFIRYLLCGQKVTPKTAAVKRFRGRSCDFAESDAYGTFEAIKSSLTQTFSRLGKARTSSALPSAYRKRSPILYAPSPRPPFIRNRFCRGRG